MLPSEPGAASDAGGWSVDFAPLGAAAVFADLWPDSLSGAASRRDLGWSCHLVKDLDGAVGRILSAHAHRSSLLAP
jgi:hypothetical protein